jgi:hypothetical protein
MEGRYIRSLEAELLALLPGEATVADRLFIDRLIRVRLQLEGLENKIEAARAGNGTWTDRDVRFYSAAGNQYRLMMRELRFSPGKGPQPRGRGRPSAARALLQAAPDHPSLISLLADAARR